MFKHPNENVVVFDSPAEFGTHYLANKFYGNHSDNSKAWYANLSESQAANLAIVGDSSKVDDAEKLIEKFQTQIETSSFMDMPSVAGCYPCVPDAIMGEPESMREPMEIHSDHAPLTILVDIASSGGINAQQMEKRGTSILALVMALSATRPITLKVFSAGNGTENKAGDGFSITAVNINTTPLDIATAAYVLCNVGYCRRLHYDYQYQYFGFTGKWAQFKGLGVYASDTEEYAEKIKQYLDVDGECLYITGALSTNETVISDPELWLKQQLEKYQPHYD